MIVAVYFSVVISTEIVVPPYLQNASPTGIYIIWESSSGSESIVEWGLSNSLGIITEGTAETGSGSSYIHTVNVTELTPDTQYYYRAVTDDAESEIFDFITPPMASSEYPFHLIAMSDMQIDNGNPNKFYEIIHDGIIDYVHDEYSDLLSEGVQMILIAGDLVDNGWNYSAWKNEFFDSASPLFSQVPVYPVLGNHEANTGYYFSYFNLPDNGSSGYEEHWWYTDYSNVRIIGLDSNYDYQLNVQLDWLENVLNESCVNEDIDFVFAQLHHPYLSELWLAGETEFTGEVITLLENFSTECDKPSIHFFGHTHGYSRGQSRDHNHLWVNVATSGGNVDYWNEYAQADYDEFTVSQDEWGFVSVDIEAGDFPQFTLTRISRGNENQFRDNEVRDVITIKLFNLPPDIPTGLFPSGNDLDPDCVILLATDFNDLEDDNHTASYWQVSEDCSDFSTLVYDKWRNSENWYNYINTQFGDDLTDELLSGLNENTEYCWRVRYRDESLDWSDWSDPVSFTTGESDLSSNLLINPGAESGTTGWIIVEGVIESLTDGECEGISPHSGERLFAVGGVCENHPYGEAYQLIDISIYGDEIDSETGFAHFGGFLSNWGGSDKPEFGLVFLDGAGYEISATETFSTLNPSWTNFNETALIPQNTREIQFVLMGTRYSGSDNDSYFDDLFFRYSTSESPCEDSLLLGDVTQDGLINILDIIMVINIILGDEPTPYQQWAGDMNEDGDIDILDIVLIVGIILG